jgi:hypothetical protein
MQSFLSTIAQISATLLSIFLAAVIAYFAFLNDHLAKFTEQIDEAKIDLASQIGQLRGWPINLRMLVPPLFQEKYRNKHPGKSSTALIFEIKTDLLFRDEELISIIHEAGGEGDGPWQGRLYYHILGEVARNLTQGGSEAQQGVFPASPTGPGYEQWKMHSSRCSKAFKCLKVTALP